MYIKLNIKEGWQLIAQCLMYPLIISSPQRLYQLDTELLRQSENDNQSENAWKISDLESYLVGPNILLVFVPQRNDLLDANAQTSEVAMFTSMESKLWSDIGFQDDNAVWWWVSGRFSLTSFCLRLIIQIQTRRENPFNNIPWTDWRNSLDWIRRSKTG